MYRLNTTLPGLIAIELFLLELTHFRSVYDLSISFEFQVQAEKPTKRNFEEHFHSQAPRVIGTELKSEIIINVIIVVARWDIKEVLLENSLLYYYGYKTRFFP